MHILCLGSTPWLPQMDTCFFVFLVLNIYYFLVLRQNTCLHMVGYLPAKLIGGQPVQASPMHPFEITFLNSLYRMFFSCNLPLFSDITPHNNYLFLLLFCLLLQ